MKQENQSQQLGRRPAGWRVAAAADTAPGSGVQQDVGAVVLGVIVANERDQLTLAWLRTQVGDAAIVDTVEGLAGARRPYVSNVARLLGLTVPDSVQVTDKRTALQKLAAIRAQLSKPRPGR